MKRIILSIFLITMLIAPLFGICGDKQASVTSTTVINAQTVVKSGTYTSSAIDLSNVRGYFSLYYAITGDGTAKFEYLFSSDDSTFLEPSGGSDVATGLTKTSGPGADGKDVTAFSPFMWGKRMKIKVTETGGVNSITVTAILNIQ